MLKHIREAMVREYGMYRQLLHLSLVALAANLGYGVLNQSAIPPYAKSIGLTVHLGIIYAAFVITETLFKPIMGSIEDRVGIKPIFAVAAVVGASAAFAWTRVRTLGWILLIRSFDGIGSSAIWTATVISMGGIVPPSRRTTAMGMFTVTYLCGLAFGPLFGGYANDRTGSKQTAFYVACALFCLAAVLAVLFVPMHLSRGEGTPDARRPRPLLEQIGRAIKSIPSFILIAFTVFFSIGLLMPIIKLFAMEQLGMSETTYGLTVLPVAIVSALCSFSVGMITARWGKAHTIHAGLLISALTLYTVPLVRHSWEFGIAAGFVGLGFVLGTPAWLALASDVADPDIRGSVIGALGAGQGSGVIFGTVASSYLYTYVPFHVLGINLVSHYTPFMLSALGLTVSFLLALVFVKEPTPLGDCHRH